jgi:hypothetical protein
MLSNEEILRYGRQMILPELGKHGLSPMYSTPFSCGFAFGISPSWNFMNR